MKEKSKKKLFYFDIAFTVFILIWAVKAFIEGDVSKGIIFSALLVIMAAVLIFNKKKR